MSVDQERLYAFGIDAFRLTMHLLRGDARRAALDGVTTAGWSGWTNQGIST